MKVTKRSCDVTPRSKYQKSKGHAWSPCASNLVQFRLLFTKLRHFEKNGTRNFSLIGRHLESVNRTMPVFKHTLAPSEKWPTQEISVRFGPFLSSYRVNIARCNLCARAKVKGHIKLKIEENTSVGKKSKGPPRSPCALNMVQFRPLFPELRHFEKNGTRHFF